jgi:sulfatase maturation enzyme AslB (radical SAM superfamily)
MAQLLPTDFTNLGSMSNDIKKTTATVDLSTIIDRKDYKTFAGPDWPSYENLIAGQLGDSVAIQQETKNFIRMMSQNYQSLTMHGDVLAQSNQQRQQQIFFDKQYHGTPCRVPWDTLGINANGDVFICLSPSWIPKFVGNILKCNDIYQILNSDLAQSIRQEILQGRYTYCNHNLCSFFSNIPTQEYQSIGSELQPGTIDRSPDLLLDRLPKNIILDFDYTCNFACPSCRTEVINNNNHHVIAPINDRIAQQIKSLIIDRIQDESISIRWCGGEPFISRVYLDLMQYISANKPHNVKHIIQTNGSYLQKKSDLIIDLLPTIDHMRVSFDAASADTYHKIRVNGQWDQLLENVRWLRKQIDQHAPDCSLQADFVVQLLNYKEIPDFVELCQDLGIDQINWQKMWNWGTWSQEEFQEHNIYQPDHRLYPELVEIFKKSGQPMSLR